MIELDLRRRGSADRARSKATKWVGSFERLESRIAMSNGLVGVPGQFQFPLHYFDVTSIPEDPENDGILGSPNLTIIGNAENASGQGTFGSHGPITIEALENGTVVGSAALGTPNLIVDPTASFRALFNFPVTLLSSTSDPQNLSFRINTESYGSLNVFRRDAPTELLTGTFVVMAAPSGPTISAISPISSPRTDPVSSINVTFSEPIDPVTFTTADLRLTRDGTTVDLDPGIVTFTSSDNTLFTIGGLAASTTELGSYTFSVDATGVTNPQGTAGTGSASVSFQVESSNAPPRILGFTPITTPRTEPVSAIGVTFSKAIDPATFTTAALTLTRDGAPVPLSPDVITITTTDNTSFSIGGLTDVTTPVGPYSFTVNAALVRDPDGNPGSGTETINFDVQAPVVDTGPRVVGLVRFGVHHAPSILMLTFDRPLNPARAVNRMNYLVFGPGRDGQIGTADDRRVPLASGYYNSANRTVTLVMAKPLYLSKQYRLTVRGTGPTAITDTNGVPLDGQSDGQAGTDFQTVFGREILAFTAPSGGLAPNSRISPVQVSRGGRYRHFQIGGSGSAG